jgi:RNA recognition motif-containing protein
MNIYVGNLPFNTDEDALRAAFEAYGQVEDVKLIKDKYTGKSKGFGFVEMPTEAEALAAIEDLNGKDFKGRNLTVNKARPRSERGRGGRRRSW